ncbi:MAG TPA: hypothetical protein VNJ12_06005 [Candidatus Dormibacteraeota bacterium]|nr:hypothetical protein [Candidatus Dormibacteraeota bacterium]
MKTYSIRVPDGATAGVTSETMRARLRQFFIDGATAGIPDDPGAGATVIRRTLPENLVAKFSASLGVPPGEALRRLAVSCTRALPPGTRQPPARALPSGPAASNPDSAPWWASLPSSLAGPVVTGQGESPAKDPPASGTAAISPWRALWPELLFAAVVVLGLVTGGIAVGSAAAAAQPYSSWRPE